jgi:hypothetical protein
MLYKIYIQWNIKEKEIKINLLTSISPIGPISLWESFQYTHCSNLWKLSQYTQLIALSLSHVVFKYFFFIVFDFLAFMFYVMNLKTKFQFIQVFWVWFEVFFTKLCFICICMNLYAIYEFVKLEGSSDLCYDPSILDLVTRPRSWIGSRLWLPCPSPN